MSVAVASPVRARRILVVEDDASVRSLVARHLQRHGHAVAAVSDAEAALAEAFRDGDPCEVILTDLHLPGMSGVELTRTLLAHAPLRPVIVMTGDADERLARTTLAHGAFAYLLKPFEFFELDAIVRQAVARLELLEATQLAARSANGAGSLPIAWLEQADEHSGAGRGHGLRVARLSGALAAALPDPLSRQERETLDVAARAHEIGILLGPVGTRVELAVRTAHLLAGLDVDPQVVRTIQTLREHWDGSGGPEGIAGPEIPRTTRVLAVADALDHHVVTRTRTGLPPEPAVAAAMEQVRAEAGQTLDPAAVQALEHRRDAVEAIWTLSRWSGPAA